MESRVRLKRWVVVMLIVTAIAGREASAVDADKPARRPGGWTTIFQFENDVFADADRDYTNGIRLSVFAPEGAVPGCLASSIESLADFAKVDEKGRVARLGFGVGQNIYTPRDITIATRLEDDRPYAGWLYASGRLQLRDEHFLQQFGIDLGIVGPSALADETQTFVHRQIDSPIPQGWKFQLKDEPGVVLSYQWRGRFNELVLGGPGLSTDFIPNAGLSVGNVLTDANVGATVRVGLNLPRDFGPPSPEGLFFTSGVKEATPSQDSCSCDVSLYGFLSADGRAVARNIFLDGNSFRSSPQVTKENFVSDVTVGAVLRAGHVSLTYNLVHRSTEFRGQDRLQRFGSVTLSIDW